MAVAAVECVDEAEAPMPCVSAYAPDSRKVACNSIGRSFNKVRKRCNSNDFNSRFEIVSGELHAKLGVGAGMGA